MRYKIGFFDSSGNIIDVVQGDSARTLELEASDYTIPSGATAEYCLEKPSGARIQDAATITDNTVTVPLTSQALSEVGENHCQVRLYKDDALITSFSVIINVAAFNGLTSLASIAAITIDETNIFDKHVAEAVDDFEEQAQEKAAETIESIPSDYTTLSNTVTDLKNELNVMTSNAVINRNIKSLSDIEAKYIRSDGDAGSSSNSVITKPIKFNTSPIVVTPTSPYKVKVIQYSSYTISAASYEGILHDYSTSSYEINATPNKYYVFVIMRTDSAQFTPSNMPDNACVLGIPEIDENVTYNFTLDNADAYSRLYIRSVDGKYTVASSAQSSVYFKVDTGVLEITANSNYDAVYALLDSLENYQTDGGVPDYTYGGRFDLTKNNTRVVYITKPTYVYFTGVFTSGSNYFPSEIVYKANKAYKNEKEIESVTEDTSEELAGKQEIVSVVNYYDSESVLSNYKLTSNGGISYDNGYVTTDFIKVPKRNNYLLNYIHATSSSGTSVVAVYDESKVFIELFDDDDYVFNEDQAYKYVRVQFPLSSENRGVYFSNESATPEYVPGKKYLLYHNDLFSYDKIVNSDGAINQIIETGLMYLGDEEFGYGTEHTAFAEECIKTTKDTHTESSDYSGERYQMDCSTYTLLMILGITPECSRYYSDKNIPSISSFKFNRLVEYEGFVYGVPQTEDTKRLYANSIAKYAYDNGLLFAVNKDYSNLKPGDVFFLSNQPSSYNFFENIGHCGIIVDVIPNVDGGYFIVTFEGNGGTDAPCKAHLYTSYINSMIYAARFPYPYRHSKAKNIAVFNSTITTQTSGVSGDLIDIGTVTLTENIVNAKPYTVYVKASIPDNCYLRLKTNGMARVGVYGNTVLIRPDGKYIFRLFSMSTDIINNPNQLTVQITCTGNVIGTAYVTEFEVYNGFISL